MRNGTRSEQRAATLVEFTIAIPIMLLFILVLIDFCAFFFVKNSLDHASRKAAAAASVYPGIDAWDPVNNKRDNQAAKNDLYLKFKPENGAPVLPALFVSTGLVKDFDIEFIEPEGSNERVDAYKNFPFTIRITAKYKSLVGFLPFMPENLVSETRAFREYQENSSLALPVDCLGNVYTPNNPAVLNPRLCPCLGSDDPLARQLDPNNPTICTCPNGLPFQLDGTCRCPKNSGFNERSGMCECFGNRSFDDASKECKCNPCTGISRQDDNCECFTCTNTCFEGATPDLDNNCACKCPDPKKEYKNDKCVCAGEFSKESCTGGPGREDYYLLSDCQCLKCVKDGAIDDFYLPDADKASCVCKVDGPEGLAAFCQEQGLEYDAERCACKPRCVPDQDRDECTCDITSTYCQEQNLGLADPEKCRCSGECTFEPQPDGAATTDIANPACPCDREKLAKVCGGAENTHPIYCTCICTNPDKSKCGPCDPLAWVQRCANEPVDGPLGLPFDWNLYEKTGICACAEGVCTGDTVLVNGRCECKPEVIASLQATCGEAPIVQVQGFLGTKCECGTDCRAANGQYSTLVGNACGCMGTNCNNAACLKQNYPGKHAELVAACAEQGAAVNPAVCGCGEQCPEPRRIIGGECVCEGLEVKKAECRRQNGSFNPLTCQCEYNCVNGYYTYNGQNNPVKCNACPTGEIYLRCDKGAPTQCTKQACCAPQRCSNIFECDCTNSGWVVKHNE